MSKINRENWKYPHRTTTIRQTIAPAGAISLRCNHSTRHLKYEPRRREAMKFAPARKFCDFSSKTVTSVNISWNFAKTTFSCTVLWPAFRLPCTVACSISSIQGTIITKWNCKKYGFVMRLCTFRKIQAWTTENYQRHDGQSCANSPSARYYSTS